MSRRSLSFVLCVQPCALAAVMFSELHNLIHLYLTVPVTSATSERAFSTLKCLLTYLCSSMTQQRLNNCALLNMHQDILDEMQLGPIAATFAVQMKSVCGTLYHSSDSLTINYIIWNCCSKDIKKINMWGAASKNVTVVHLQYESNLIVAAAHKTSRIQEVSYLYLEYLSV